MISIIKGMLARTWIVQKLGKPRAELRYWKNMLNNDILSWFEGKKAFRYRFPKPEEKETRFDYRKNAVMTYIRFELEHASYLSDLKLRKDAFVGKRVADIGCGAFPLLLVFENCERWGFDHLINKYMEIGYPLEEFKDQATFVNCKSEKIPVPDNFFDVVISRNSLDHVDDFSRTCREIKRILKPGGFLRLQINHHSPTVTEPLAIQPEDVYRNLADTGIRQIDSEKGARGFADGVTALWSTPGEGGEMK